MRIKSVRSGVKISINVFEDQIVYSDVLLALEEFGLEVVNATSSSINNTVFHTIHNKVFYYNSLPVLQNSMVLQVSGFDHFSMDNLYVKLRHLISNNQGDLGAP